MFAISEIILFVGFMVSSFYIYYLVNELTRCRSFNATILQSNQHLFVMYMSANDHANKCLDYYKQSNDQLIKVQIELLELKSKQTIP